MGGAVRPPWAPRGRPGETDAPDSPPGERIPRVARVLALAHHWRGLIRSGTVRDQADLARLIGVSRARVTQVMNLLWLAPDIQRQVLTLLCTAEGRDRLNQRDLMALAAEARWPEQRIKWRELTFPVTPLRCRRQPPSSPREKPATRRASGSR